MKPGGKFTREEILSQTHAWQEALEVVARHESMLGSTGRGAPSRRLLFTGCGSTYYLALAAAAHLRALTGWCAHAVPASELWFYPEAYIQPDDTLVAISRSGMTTETLHAVEAFKGVTHRLPITIQCTPDAPLAQRAGLNIVTPSGAERSVVQTRSFASMFVATVALNARWAQRSDLVSALMGLPQAGERVLQLAGALARDWGARLEFDRLYFLGSGTRYGLACEASLKMKEMALSHTEPFHFLEFRHGPKSMVNETTLVVGLVSDEAAAEEARILSEAAALGAQVYVLGERVEPIGGGPAVSFDSRLPPETRDVLYLPPLQLLAYERALARGLDPDRPRHLDAVVVFD
jgi:glucosamine--fructose-6-phosphate aminotransferase (isomerizing)